MELTVRERLSIAISRELRDGEVVLTGAASAVPLAACLLAQARHAPALTILGAGVYINPRRLVPEFTMNNLEAFIFARSTFCQTVS